MDIFNHLNLVEIQAAGLADLWDNLLGNWITYIYLGGVAFFAVIFLKDRAWMKLISFVGIAAIVGVLVFGGQALFGGQDKGLTKVAVDAANNINTITAPAWDINP